MICSGGIEFSWFPLFWGCSWFPKIWNLVRVLEQVVDAFCGPGVFWKGKKSDGVIWGR